MCRTKIACLTLLSMLLVAACCQIGYSARTLTLDDLPSSGESWAVSSDSVLTADVGEKAVVDWASLSVNGTDDALTTLEIVNNGENATITFNVSFIEDVNSEILTSIGPEGHQFVEASGGTITVTNKGLMTEQSGRDAPSSSEYILYIIIIIAAVIVSLFVILRRRKKSSKTVS